MKKRGQLSSETFVYAMTIVIVGVILVMGYKYISSSKKIIDKGELLQFQNKLVFDINSVGKDFGRLKKVSYSIPRNLEEVCFVDLSKKNEILSSKIISFYPTIKDSIQSGLNKNIFYIGAADLHSLHVESLGMNHYPFMNCFHQKNGKIGMGIEGLGGGKAIILADFKTQAKISTDDKTILHSADEIVTIEASKGTQPSGVYISIEMVQPTRAEFESGTSDVYKFEPIRVRFTPPLELRFKYNPAIVGECPNQLPFNQISEDGTKKTTLSESIDCKSKIVYFDIDEFI